MTSFVQPLLRRAAACLNGAFCASANTRFAMLVALVAAIASASH